MTRPTPNSGTDRVVSSYKKLETAASHLNEASDSLAKSISRLDLILKKLGLGVSSWLEISSFTEEDSTYVDRYIGYAKINGKWGLALSEIAGHRQHGTLREEEWLFNDAPRMLRIEAIPKIPDFIDNLTMAAVACLERLIEGKVVADGLADALQLAASEPNSARR